MRGYPFDPSPGGEPAGRVPLPDEVDGGGVFKTARVFAERLRWSSAIARLDGEISVSAATGHRAPEGPHGRRRTHQADRSRGLRY